MSTIKCNKSGIAKQDPMEQLNLLSKVMGKGMSCEEEEVKLVLMLLRDLPPCREAVLECLGGLLRKVLELYLHRSKIKDDAEIARHSRLVGEVECSLMHLITTDPSLWSFTIAQWSIELLGLMDSEVGGSGVAILTWTNCPSIQLLMHVLNKSLHNLSGEQLCQCFDQLLDTPSKNSASFEGTIAQISASFPEEMLSRMLQRGLEDYCNTPPPPPPPSTKDPPPPAPSANVRGYSSRLERVACILTHLTQFKHLHIHNSLLKLLQTSLEEEGKQARHTPLFLLHLSSHSPPLLKLTTQIFFDFVDARVLKLMVRRLQQLTTCTHKQLTDLLTAVLLTSEHLSTQLLDLLLHLACGDFSAFAAGKAGGGCGEEDKELERNISLFCSNLLNTASISLQRLSSLPANQANLINSLNTNLTSLSRLFRPPFYRQKHLFKLLTPFCHYFPSSAPHLLSLILSQCSSHKDLAIFKQLQRAVSFKQPSVLHDTVARVVRMLEVGCQGSRFKSLSLLHRLCLLEKTNAFNTTTTTSGNQEVCSVLTKFHSRLTKLLYFPPPTTSTHSLKNYITNTNNNHTSKPQPHTTTNVADSSGNNATTASNNTPQSTTPATMLYTFNIILLDLLSIIKPKEGQGAMEDQAELLETASILINLLFTSLIHLRGAEKVEVVRGVVDRLQGLCCHGNQQHVISTLLLEALSEKHLPLLNCPPRKTPTHLTRAAIQSVLPCVTTTFQTHNLASADHDNRPFGLLFHTGNIGNGVNNNTSNTNNNNADNKEEEEDLLLNEFLFLHALQSCCMCNRGTSTSEARGGGGLMDEGVVRGVSVCVLQQCMPDSLSSGVVWGDEEGIKTNYARDLLVKKEFVRNSLLRKILDILIHSERGVWQCSGVLRSLLGHLVMYWEACREEGDRREGECALQLHLTTTVVTLLNEGGMLPPPLSLVGELLPHVSSHEIFLLLLEVWTFLKEKNPTPNSCTTCDSRYSEVLRMVMMRNIQQCGHLFPFFFQ